jgi:hypothetical protein
MDSVGTIVGTTEFMVEQTVLLPIRDLCLPSYTLTGDNAYHRTRSVVVCTQNRPVR